jgi:hypothetical protein
MERMRRIYSTDRWFTFPKFQQTAEYLKSAMTEIGLERVEILAAPADGVSQAGFWTMPMAWDAKRARLEIVEPKLPRDQSVLADFEKVPTSLGMWSRSTPPQGITAEIVGLTAVSPGDILKQDLHGKLVLTSVNPAEIRWLLVDAAFFYYLANAGEPKARWLAEISTDYWRSQAGGQSADKTAYLAARLRQAVLSVLRLFPPERHTALRESFDSLLGATKPAIEKSGSDVVVVRKRFGTVPLDDLPVDMRAGFPSGA